MDIFRNMNSLRLAPTSQNRLPFIVGSLATMLIAWELLVRLSGLPAYILPGPSLVLIRLVQASQSGVLWEHSLATFSQIVFGLAAGVVFAAAGGYALARSPVIERLLAPYLVASQAVPVAAIAPLLVIWFKPGIFTKVLICALIVFFPVLVNTIVGVRSVPEDLRDLMRSLRATAWQTFIHLEVPAALPVFFGGLRIGATLSVIGAVVGEFVIADQGLGFLIMVAKAQYDTPLVFVAILSLVSMALGLYGLVALLERRLLAWQVRPNGNHLLPKGS